MEERNYAVYMHVCKDNGKKYIGITKNKLQRRWENGKGYKKSPHFNNAIEKYGWDNFEHITIAKGLTKEEAEYFEIILIKLWKSNDKEFGYNIAKGGNVGLGITDEIITKASKTRMGKYTRGNSWHAKKVYCDGIVFACIKDCADHYNIDEKLLADWLRGHRRMPIDFFELGLRCLDSDTILEPQKRIQRKVICESKIFETIKECSDYYHINEHTMAHWLNGRNRMREDFYEKGLRFIDSETILKVQIKNKQSHTTKVICDNIIYNTIKECAEFYGANPSSMCNWLTGFRKTPQEFIDMGLAYYIEN